MKLQKYKDKEPCSLTNLVMGYRGEIMLKFKINTDAVPTIYKDGEKIAQLIIMPYPKIEPVFAENLEESDRGENGYGSTDSAVEETKEAA